MRELEPTKSVPNGGGVISSSQTPSLVKEEAPFQKSGMNKNVVMDPDSKNDCAGEDQQKFTGL
jgi:hypothetical protein